jgi:hypothetical protein
MCELRVGLVGDDGLCVVSSELDTSADPIRGEASSSTIAVGTLARSSPAVVEGSSC